MFFPFFDPLYLLLIAPAFIAAMWAQSRVRGTYRKYSQVMASSGMPAHLAARRLLDAVGLTSVEVKRVPGELTDHYDPRHKVLRLSDGVYESSSLAAVAIAAVGFVLAITYLSRTSLTRRLALEGAVTATTAGEIEARADLVGRIAEAHEPLHPSGLVDVGGEMMSARAEHGSFISRGDAVEIIAVEFGEIVVRTHTPAPEADDGR